MKGIAGYLLGTLVLALLGGACLAIGLLERDLARTEQNIVTLNYDGADATFQTTERYFEYASHVPWIGNGPLNDVRARQAALHYWQGDYGTIVPRQNDPVTAIASDNVELQFVVANAVFRAGLSRAKNLQATLQALNVGMNAYLAVLKNAKRHEEAAYNFEYLVRFRDDVEKGRRRPGLPVANPSVLGALGLPLDLRDTGSFKIYIPLDSGERVKASDAGKVAPRPRKG